MSSEFIIAASIFMFVLLTVLVMWTSTVGEINRSEVLFEMDDSATNAIEKLVRTSGFPVAWESLPVDDVLSIGLVNESRVLDPGKVLRFLDIMEDTSSVDPSINPCGGGVSNYECNRHFLGLGRYDFLFNVTYLNGSVVSVQGVDFVTGLVPGDVEFMLSKRRNALLGDDIVRVTLTVFYGEGSGSAIPSHGPTCGDGVCAPTETPSSCPADCTCGNGTRDPGEECDFGWIPCPVGFTCQPDCTCVLSVPSGPPGAEEFGVPDASGDPGDTVSVPVNISNSQGSIMTIGFDVHYDIGIISLVDVQRGDLTAAWDVPSYADYGWGSRVTMVFGGGMTYISPGSTGSVVVLDFEVVGVSGTSPMDIDSIQLSNLDGVVDTAPSLNGTFTVT